MVGFAFNSDKLASNRLILLLITARNLETILTKNQSIAKAMWI